MIGVRHFGRALRESPRTAVSGLAVEYAGYIGACGFIAFLVATRVPFGVVDRVFGTRIREGLIQRLARVSPC